MKLEYKVMSVYEVLDLFEYDETTTMSELISKGALEMTVCIALCNGWIERIGEGRGMYEKFRLTEIGCRVKKI